METFYKPSVRNIINTGNEVNSNTGDFVRVGFLKTQKNFEELCDKLDVLNVDCLNDFVVTPCPDDVGNVTQRTYSITPNVTLVDLNLAETNNTVRYTVETTNVSDNTILHWTNSGTTSETNFTDNVDQNTTAIQSNYSFFDRTIEAETIQEETTIELELRKTSYFSPIVASANTVTILPRTLMINFKRESYSDPCWQDLSLNEYEYCSISGSDSELFSTLTAWSSALPRLSDGAGPSPRGYAFLADKKDFVKISSLAAIKSDGTLWDFAYGFGNYGRANNYPQGVVLDGFLRISNETDWVFVETSILSYFAIKSDGSLWAWGDNTFGQLGTGDLNSRALPTQIGIGQSWKYVSAGSRHTAAITTSGVLYVWGNNEFGQLGTGNFSNTTSAVTGSWSGPVIDVSCGAKHTAIVTSSGVLYTCGDNTDGAIGNGIFYNPWAPEYQPPNPPLTELQIRFLFYRATPYAVGGGYKKVFCSTASSNTFGLTTNGAIMGWGRNTDGVFMMEPISMPSNLYLQTEENIHEDPFLVDSGPWKELSNAGFYVHGIKTDGTLWAWGSNTFGALGISTDDAVPRITPMQIPSGPFSDGYSDVNSRWGYGANALRIRGAQEI